MRRETVHISAPRHCSGFRTRKAQAQITVAAGKKVILFHLPKSGFFRYLGTMEIPAVAHFQAGQRLRAIREQLGLTIRDVEEASARIAVRHKNDEFSISLSRLSDIETKGVLPSIHRIYSLAIIYRRDMREILALYGIDLNETATDLGAVAPTKTHMVRALDANATAYMPVKLDPSFDLKRTSNLGRMVEKWGIVPLAALARFATAKYTYGYIGTEDFTMYPLLLPGSFVQVDEAKNEVAGGMWRSEYERPIYFIETREGFYCSWCTVKGEQIVLQPHPLSPAPVRIFRHPREAEVIGQVVGVAMRLTDWQAAAREAGLKQLPRPN